MARKKDMNWNLPENNSWESIHAALLMDIRDELQQLNRTLGFRFQTHFHKGMDAMIRADKRMATKINLRAKQSKEDR